MFVSSNDPNHIEIELISKWTQLSKSTFDPDRISHVKDILSLVSGIYKDKSLIKKHGT